MPSSTFADIPHCKLSTGALMPLIGLGTWQSAPKEIDLAIRTAIDVGYRLIDTAQSYGNEADIGNTLHQLFKDGKLKREDIFITTKIWCTHNRPEETESTLKESLRKLQLDYVDLYLVHMPVAYNHEMTELDHSVSFLDTWKGMEGVFDRGLAKAIGVSNFNAEQVQRICDTARVKPHNIQVEAYLYFPQFELHDACKKLDISFTAYAPLGSPGRVDFSLPSGAKLVWAPAPNPFDDPIVIRLAEKYKKTKAQIMLRWLLERGMAIVPKSINPERIRENFELTDFSLTDAEVTELNQVKPRQRLFLQDFMAGHADDPFKDERH